MPTLEEMRRDLERVLQETDHDRELDSLEITTVLAYLVGKEYEPGPPPADQAPRTIGGWLAWAERSFAGS
ncbi:hypothetical protein E1258_17470 [Micromonospora sp. KC207]|uniref:hypothetical protein n=1 Tax=Micromonospora sp. KC207 TaxID=2530377 RepID=UPI00104872B2|nr:hypothetical protein [Micromonospora sp. KC207]TDC59573.1 hypothetical protein E1258_17470 [Micromonospora sp. KC207]